MRNQKPHRQLFLFMDALAAHLSRIHQAKGLGKGTKAMRFDITGKINQLRQNRRIVLHGLLDIFDPGERKITFL